MWSSAIFRSWEEERAVFDLVEWAHTADMPSPAIVDLFATALGWCLTTSHRFLRDRATAALVDILTNELEATIRFVERFAGVDDPYVSERVYAVAYGVSTRSRDKRDGIARLARVIYTCHFEHGPPPVHILLRYYAQGVVELASALGVVEGLDVSRVRPPYGSTWPDIPSEADVEPYLPDWSSGSFDTYDPVWSRNMIGTSVMTMDFASYVLFADGAESTSRFWLDRRLDEPAWDPDLRIRDFVESIVDGLGDRTRLAWERCRAWLDRELSRPKASPLEQLIQQWGYPTNWDPEQWFTNEEAVADSGGSLSREDDSNDDHESIENILAELRASTTRPEIEDVCRLVTSMADGCENVERPGLPLAPQQRYIIHRAFDLGWTLQRFGDFDRFTAHRSGRDAGKPERISKKYQWLAWHELQALMADNFQFAERYSKDPAGAYEGPWQMFVRDIDPTCTLRALPARAKDEARVSWWKAAECPAVHSTVMHGRWIRETSGLPPLAELLCVQAPESGTTWLNLDASFNWSGPRPSHLDYYEAPQRELWLGFTAYLIRRRDVGAFCEWAKGVDFWNRWMPGPGDNIDVLLGEFGWAPSWKATRWGGDAGDAWIRPERGCPVDVLVAGERYLRESGSGATYDCATDESYTLHLPCEELRRGAGFTWAGVRADFRDRYGELASQDPATHSAGPGCLLVRRDAVLPYLERDELTICWAILGEKRQVGGPDQAAGRHLPRLRLSGFGHLDGDAVRGWVKYLDDRHSGDELPVIDTASW